MKELKCKVRVGLTGTILQNNLEELWCVMDWWVMGKNHHGDHYLHPVIMCSYVFWVVISSYFVGFRANPGCLGSLGGFKNEFSDPIEQGQKHSATKRILAEGRKAVQTLARILCRWFLRRTKALISDQLPKKDDRVSLSIQSIYLIIFRCMFLFFKQAKPTTRTWPNLMLDLLKRWACMYMPICRMWTCKFYKYLIWYDVFFL